MGFVFLCVLVSDSPQLLGVGRQHVADIFVDQLTTGQAAKRHQPLAQCADTFLHIHKTVSGVLVSGTGSMVMNYAQMSSDQDGKKQKKKC